MPTVRVVRPGDAGKPDPFTICVISNPALESPWKSNQFQVDPITNDEAGFDLLVRFIEQALFGLLPEQAEPFLSDPGIAPGVRLVSLFVSGLEADDVNSLVAEDGVSDLLIARRARFRPFLERYGLVADVAYAISQSESHTRPSAWPATDDDSGSGVAFTIDGATFHHRHRCIVPGTVAQHAASAPLTALHEFGHALSSYSNGLIVDLYEDSPPAINNRHGRPIPEQFAVYDGIALASDRNRNGLGYPAGWRSFHCELNDASFPALMDNYWLAHDGIPEHCQHDVVTRRFLLDRVRAKLAR